MSELLFGIDFGTTFCTVAASEGETARVIEGPGGERVMPSVVYYGADGNRQVGHVASQRGLLEPERTISAVKRLIGRSFDTRVVQEFIKTAPFSVEADDQRYCVLKIGDRRVPPGQVATEIFSTLRDRAKAATGATVISAVITAPAHFGAAERRAIHAAATRAEIDVIRILTEPTAASVAYGAKGRVGERVLTFDLGGGTLDVTVLRIDEGVHEILAVGGHPLLGGIDFDLAIYEELASLVLVQTGHNVHKDPVAKRRLLAESEQMKCELTEVSTVSHVIPLYIDNTDVTVAMNRSVFESRISRLVDRAVEIAEGVLKDSGLHKSEIDRVLLVGGSTRVPLVRQRLEAAFPNKLSLSVHPQEAVALGAAIFGASLGTSKAMRLLDVLPSTIGLSDDSKRLVPLLKRNTSLPTEGSFELAFGDDADREIVLFQGEQEYVTDNEFLGTVHFSVDGVPVDKAIITLRADGEGLVTVSAFDVATGRVLRTRFSLRVSQRLSAWAR